MSAITLSDDDDQDEDLDLRRAIAASLETAEVDSAPSRNGGGQAWHALIAAGQAVGDTGRRGRSPALLLPPAEDDEDSQLAAALAASLESAAEDERRRRHGSSSDHPRRGVTSSAPAVAAHVQLQQRPVRQAPPYEVDEEETDGEDVGGGAVRYSGGVVLQPLGEEEEDLDLEGWEGTRVEDGGSEGVGEEEEDDEGEGQEQGEGEEGGLGQGGQEGVLEEEEEALEGEEGALEEEEGALEEEEGPLEGEEEGEEDDDEGSGPADSEGAGTGGALHLGTPEVSNPRDGLRLGPPLPPAQLAAPAGRCVLGLGAARMPGAAPPACAGSLGSAAATAFLSSSPGKHARTPCRAEPPDAAQPLVKRSRPAAQCKAPPLCATDSGAASGPHRPRARRDDPELRRPGPSARLDSPPERPASAASGCTAADDAPGSASAQADCAGGAPFTPSGCQPGGRARAQAAPAGPSCPLNPNAHAHPGRATGPGALRVEAEEGPDVWGGVVPLGRQRAAALPPPPRQSPEAEGAFSMRPQQLQGQGRGAASPEAGGPAPMHVDAAAGGAEADAAAAAAAAPCSGADRRLHMQQKVWWWLGPGQVQAGHISAVDRRSEPLLYSVRLEAQPSWEAAGGGGGGGGGEEVMATAACLLPYLVYGDRIMCRLPPQPSAPCAGSQLVAPSAEEGPCAWSCGLLEHCVFDGDEPAVQVLLLQGGERVPCLLPYDRIVPVQDVAEGSGGGWGRSRGREASEAAAAVAAAAPALAPGWLVPSTASAKLI